MTENKRIYFLKQLNHPDTEVREKAIRELGRFQDPHIYKILTSYFSDGHPRVREALFQVFTRHKSRQIAEVVADTLHSSQVSVRSLAMEILRVLSREALMPLRRLTKSSNPEVRKIAVELLGDIKHPGSAEILLYMLDDPDENVRLAAIEGLGKQKEIRAVPRLFEMYRSRPENSSVIFSSLSKIFLHWEKFLVQPGMLNTDLISVSLFLNLVQANGNLCALHVLIDWLSEKKKEMGDEVLRALSAILRENPSVILPAHIFPVIVEIGELYSDRLPRESVWECISRIPCSDALWKLAEHWSQEKTGKFAEPYLLQYLSRFFSVFLHSYFDIARDLRLKIVHLLIEKEIPVYDGYLVALSSRVKNNREKEALLRLAVRNRIPEAKRILLARISARGKNHVAETLSDLLFYPDESLWHLYLKYLHHKKKEVREVAIKGLSQYPQKTFHYVQENFPRATPSEVSLFLSLIFNLPDRYLLRFLQDECKETDRCEKVKSFLSQPENRPFLLRLITSYPEVPEMVHRLLQSFSAETMELFISSEAREYLNRLSPEEQRKVVSVLKMYWGDKVDSLLAIPEKEFSPSNGEGKNNDIRIDVDMITK